MLRLSGGRKSVDKVSVYTMRTDIYLELKRRIIHNIYKPGELIRESDIAQEFQVSRTPVREVFQNLQHDWLITLIPHRGAQVTYIELDFFLQVVELKRNLEGFAARLAARWATERDIQDLSAIVERFKGYNIDQDAVRVLEDDTLFHSIVHRAGRNSVLLRVIEQLQPHIDRIYFYAEYVTEPMLEDFVRDFSTLIQGLKARDEEMVVQSTLNHLDGYYEIIKRYF